MRRYMLVLAIYALGGLSGCPKPPCGSNGSSLTAALTAVQIAGDAATIEVEILASQGTISPADAATARTILDALSVGTHKSLIETGSDDDEKTCYETIAKNYTPVLQTIPSIPPGTAAQINLVIDLVDTVLNIVGTTPPPHSADTHLPQESTLACFDNEVLS